MATSNNVSAQDINQHLSFEGAYFSEFIHENYSPTHTVDKGTYNYTSPYGNYSITEDFHYVSNANHTMSSSDYTIKEGGNTFTYSDHYSYNASGAYNIVEKSTINGVAGPDYHYNSHA